MSIGATLAAARRRAGLTVGEVSHRTRVTEPIIRGIEQDDYAACGGDFYARGHIRAIARAVGEDPLPLIDEFDSTWRSAQETTAAEAFQPGMPLQEARAAAGALDGVPGRAGAGGPRLRRLQVRLRRGPGTARVRRRQPAFLPAACRTSPTASTPAVQAGTAQASPVQTSPATTAPSSAPASPRPVAVQVLTPASVAAFGPAGLADGDNPQLAALAVGGNAATPWSQPVVRHLSVRRAEDRNGPAARHGPDGHRLLGPAFAGQPLRCRPPATGRAPRPSRRGCPRWRPPRTRAARCGSSSARRCTSATCSSGSPSCRPTMRAPTRPASTGSSSRAALTNGRDKQPRQTAETNGRDKRPSAGAAARAVRRGARLPSRHER